jgi:hypothetical protein
MRDDLERRLAGLTPRGAPAELRARILLAVEAELAREVSSRPRRRFPFSLATAAALLLSVGLNYGANRASDARLDRAFGPRPVSPRALAIARDVAEVAGPEAGRWTLDRLSSTVPGVAPDLARHAAEVERLARELSLETLEDVHEAPHPEIPQVDRDRRRPLPGGVLLVERVVHAGDRPTA